MLADDRQAFMHSAQAIQAVFPVDRHTAEASRCNSCEAQAGAACKPLAHLKLCCKHFWASGKDELKCEQLAGHNRPMLDIYTSTTSNSTVMQMLPSAAACPCSPPPL